MRNILFMCLAAFRFCLFADEQSFQTKELLVAGEKIHAICSFDQIDYFTTFTAEGEFLWEIPFAAKIISWKKEEDQIFILSHARDGLSYFLSSINTSIGKIVWEKGIFAPTSASDTSTIEL